MAAFRHAGVWIGGGLSITVVRASRLPSRVAVRSWFGFGMKQEPVLVNPVPWLVFKVSLFDFVGICGRSPWFGSLVSRTIAAEKRNGSLSYYETRFDISSLFLVLMSKGVGYVECESSPKAWKGFLPAISFNAHEIR